MSHEWANLGLSSATVHEAAGRRGALPSTIGPIAPGIRVSGPAFTVQCPERDNLHLHYALAEAPAGSVVVCHVSGNTEAGYFGDVMTYAAVERGLAGLVIAGCVRDVEALRASPFAVFATGLCIRGTTKDPLLPGAVGCRLRFGDVDVNPGDLVIGDDDGVVVIPTGDVDEVVERSRARDADEADIRDRLSRGDTTLEIYTLPSKGAST